MAGVFDTPDSAILTRILSAVVPVCAGINLEYYFSHVDNSGIGCGTKLPHNVASLLGVMEGRLEKVPYLAGFDYSIADIASYPWAVAALDTLEKIQPDRPPLPAVRAWLERVGERRAVRKGMDVLRG